MCMNTLIEEREGCKKCGEDIFDASAFEIINGAPYLVCNSAVSLHVSVCKFYCHANWNPLGGGCVRLSNGAPVCECYSSVTGSPQTTTTTKPNIGIENGLIHYWPINNDLKDYVATAHLTPAVSAGKTGFAPNRLGVANGAIFVNGSHYSLPEGIYFSGPFTVMGWVNVIQCAIGSNFFSFGNLGNSDGVRITLCSQDQSYRPQFVISGLLWEAVLQGSSTLPLNVWTHFAVTWTGNSERIASLYINGALISSANWAQQVSNASRKVNSLGTPSLMVGANVFDEFRIYNRALSASEIQYQMSINI